MQSYLIIHRPREDGEMEILVGNKLILDCMIVAYGKPLQRPIFERIQDFGKSFEVKLKESEKSKISSENIYKLLRGKHSILFPGPGLLTYPGGSCSKADEKGLQIRDIDIAKNGALREFSEECGLKKELQEIPNLASELRSKMKVFHVTDYSNNKKEKVRACFFSLSEENFLNSIKKFISYHVSLQRLFFNADGQVSMRHWIDNTKKNVNEIKHANFERLEDQRPVLEKNTDIEISDLRYLTVKEIHEYYAQGITAATRWEISRISVLICWMIGRFEWSSEVSLAIRLGMQDEYNNQKTYISAIADKLKAFVSKVSSAPSLEFSARPPMRASSSIFNSWNKPLNTILSSVNEKSSLASQTSSIKEDEEEKQAIKIIYAATKKGPK